MTYNDLTELTTHLSGQILKFYLVQWIFVCSCVYEEEAVKLEVCLYNVFILDLLKIVPDFKFNDSTVSKFYNL